MKKHLVIAMLGFMVWAIVVGSFVAVGVYEYRNRPFYELKDLSPVAFGGFGVLSKEVPWGPSAWEWSAGHSWRKTLIDGTMMDFSDAPLEFDPDDPAPPINYGTEMELVAERTWWSLVSKPPTLPASSKLHEAAIGWPFRVVVMRDLGIPPPALIKASERRPRQAFKLDHQAEVQVLWGGVARCSIWGLLVAIVFGGANVCRCSWRAARRLGKGRCPRCGYPMGGVAVCSECGGSLPLVGRAHAGPKPVSVVGERGIPGHESDRGVTG